MFTVISLSYLFKYSDCHDRYKNMLTYKLHYSDVSIIMCKYNIYMKTLHYYILHRVLYTETSNSNC